MFLCVAVLLCKDWVAEYCVTFFTPRSQVPSVYIRVTAGNILYILVRFSSFKVCYLASLLLIGLLLHARSSLWFVPSQHLCSTSRIAFHKLNDIQLRISQNCVALHWVYFLNFLPNPLSSDLNNQFFMDSMIQRNWNLSNIYNIVCIILGGKTIMSDPKNWTQA